MMIIDGSNGITFPDTSKQYNSYYNFKNRIINGAMVIDQRNAGASITPTAFVYTLDRWYADCTVASKFSVQRNAGSVTPPAGFTNYLGVTSLAATTPGAADFYTVGQVIEGFNAADLAWGTASASTVTLSFWVRSSLTGTFGGVLNNSGGSRAYPFTYSIASANTWEKKTVTVAGDTSGTWLTNNGAGIEVKFSLGVGSTYAGTAGAWTGSNKFGATGQVNVVATNGATFYVTGAQFEKGTQATSFDYRPYSTELALCQRYFETFATSTDSVTPYQGIVGFFATTTQLRSCIPMKVTKRASPTVTIPTTNVNINYSGGNANASSPSSNFVSNETVGIQISLASGSSTTGYAGTINFFTGNPVLISSEL
jgi:hypothetical protein